MRFSLFPEPDYSKCQHCWALLSGRAPSLFPGQIDMQSQSSLSWCPSAPWSLLNDHPGSRQLQGFGQDWSSTAAWC